MTGKARHQARRHQTLFYQARLARRALRRLAQMARYRRLSLQGVPILFANSFPKSGTHLLTQVLQGFAVIGPAVNSGLPAIVTFRPDTGQQRPLEDILRDLERLLPGDIGFGHLHAIPEVIRFFTQDDALLHATQHVASYFILRDPRDVTVSHVHYITEMEPNHIHHRYYSEELMSFDQRLQTSILGLSKEFPNIYQRFEPFLGWLEHPGTLVLRYEDFLTRREQELNRVLDHALAASFPLTKPRPEALRTLEQSINPSRSPTFRSGKIGAWKDQFSPENKRLFKEIAGDLLIQLGYESDNGW
jgi:sulfotransferase 6B1